MKSSLEITFLGMSPSPTVEAAIARWHERLENVYDRIQHCHVWVEIPHRHHQHGAQFEARIVIGIPGREIVVSNDHDDVYVALADAFTAVRRQLLAHTRVHRGSRGHAA